MNKSKILRAVLTAVLTLVATTASAHDFEVKGIFYKKNSDGTVSVTYKGSTYDRYDNEYTGDVVIPSSVTYSETTYSVTSIGDYAFMDCSGLTSVTIPNSVNSISDRAFKYCSGLTSVTIPNSITSIGSDAFYYCSGLTSVTIPNSVTSIGYGAFSGCSGLTRVDISSIEAWLGIKFDNSTSNPLDYAHHLYLNGEEVKDLVIPNSVTSIGSYAFSSCSGLTSVTIPNSVTSIGNYAFCYCSGLTSVTIPNSVNSIGNSAFRGCSGLESIVVESGNSKYDSRDNCNAIIETATNTLLAGFKNTTIPNSVTSIGNYAFDGCSGLTSVTIPNSVTSIGNYAFCYCSGLTSVTIPNSVTSIGSHAFEGCSGLTSVTIPNSVTSIGTCAFYRCSGLTSVTIGNSVTSIGDSAFCYCSGLTTIFYNAENCADKTNYSDVFGYIYRRQKIIIGKDVKKVPDYLFYYLYYVPTSVISKSVTPPSCGENTFNSNAYTTAKLYVPSGAIEDYKAANVWKNFTTIEGIGTNDAVNVADLIEGTNKVNFGLQGVKMHDGVLYACTTAKSVNESYPTLHGNNPDNMDTYEDRNFAEFAQRDWVAISGLEDGFVGKELSYPFVATFAEGVLTPSGTITATADATAYTLNTFRAENILHGGYSNYAEGDYKAYYVPARVNEVAKFMGLIKTTVGGVKYLYSNNAYGGEGIKIEGNIADNSTKYSILEGILVADASTKAGVKIIMLQDLGEATGVEGVDTAAARIYTANGCIIIATAEDGEAAVYDFTGRLIKSVPVVAGDNTAVPVVPGCYIVRTGVKTQSVVVK